MIINIVVYIILAVLSLNPIVISNNILIWVAEYNYLVLFYFFYYQIVSAIFVHLNLAHLLSNSLFLLIFGYRCEDFYSTFKYLNIYLISGIVGNLLSLLFGPNFLSGGSSGAIFGIFSAAYLLIGILFLIFSGAQYGVNPISHWSGFITGLLLGKYLLQNSAHDNNPKNSQKKHKKKILLKS
ncbi:MAG: rhomboid family intramembrane serine protease [Candidatus Helarchaeota archaeon]